jgi:molybdopterin-containing oxidoreductase family iron-sulfur binding subunit
VQPLIEPLYGGRSDVELLALLCGSAETSGHDEVRATWRTLVADAGFESAWRRVLHDGLLPGAQVATAPQSRPGLVAALAGTGADDGLEMVFSGSWALHDGRFANNAWLQETPDPITKLTWDNAALMSPATMAALGLENEDVVLVRHEAREVELPAWAVPGQAEGTVAVTLGYGRQAAGRVGSGVGANAYSLRTSAAPWIVSGVSVESTGRRANLATTQEHGVMEGRPLVREATLEQWRARPRFASEAVAMPPLEQPFGEHGYDRGPQWGMAIDLNACTGCNACMLACQSENNVPIVGREQVRKGREMHWLRIDRYFVDDGEGHAEGHDHAGESVSSGAAEPPDPQMAFQPVPCMHCENAPCEQVCPVAATVHDKEGLNVMVYNRCIGTRYCSNNCPYKVRRFNFYNFTKDMPEVQKMAMNPDVTVRSRGVMEKCTYCIQRINAGKIRAKLEGRLPRDGEIRTACQQACPAEAISFGDTLDPQSEVARRKTGSRDYVILEELNNRPRTSYLARLRNPHPDLA